MKGTLAGIALLLAFFAAPAQQTVDVTHINGHELTGSNLPVEIKKNADVDQLIFTTESWGQPGSTPDILELSHNAKLPQELEICGRGLKQVTGTLFSRVDADQYDLYFPLTVPRSTVPIPNEGCFFITPEARLRIRGFGSMTTETRPRVVIVAKY